MQREFNVLSKLSKVYYPAPKPLIYCADEAVIGSDFYLMERRGGLIIRGKSPEKLENSFELQKSVCESFIENLAELHALDYEKNRTRRFRENPKVTRNGRSKAGRNAISTQKPTSILNSKNQSNG
jgi:aminoglycoside phosphotransferase (APT) family kinase protein